MSGTDTACQIAKHRQMLVQELALLQGICLRTCYAMPGTDLACTVRLTFACYAMSGPDLPCGPIQMLTSTRHYPGTLSNLRAHCTELRYLPTRALRGVRY
eukprot:2186236-Rhodomonas_salina.3